MSLEVLRIAAFATGGRGGNPAGVVIAESHPDESDMRHIAANVEYSETAFVMLAGIPPEPGSSIRIAGRARPI